MSKNATDNLTSRIFRILDDNPDIRKKIKQEFRTSAATSNARKSHSKRDQAVAFSREIAARQWGGGSNKFAIKMAEEAIQPLLIKNGFREYATETIRNWIKDLAPEHLRKGGRQK